MRSQVAAKRGRLSRLEVSLFLLLVIICPAASAGQDVERQEDEDLKELLQRWGHAFELYSFEPIAKRTLSIGFADVELVDGAHGPMLNIKLKKKIIGTDMLLSMYVMNRVYGSPAWDAVAIPRMSLNKCPITGWYYWDK